VRASLAPVVFRLGRIPPERFWLNQAKTASARGRNVIYDIFEGTAEIQQLVISRAISGMQIR
jgi:hypothetical protein